MKYILGAGIAGLIYGFYHKDYILVSPEIGGQMKNNFNLGPRYLHDTTVSRQFLTDISYPIKESSIRVSYIDDNGIVENPDLEFRQKYFMKSRSTSSLDGFDPSVMNSGKNEFDILLVDFDEIIEVLKNKIGENRFLKKYVTSVTNNSHILTVSHNNSTQYLRYEKIVSTIPKNIVMKTLCPSDTSRYEAHDSTYVFVHSFEPLKKFDFMYDVRSSTKFHRITKEQDGVVLDYFGDVDVNDTKLNGVRPFIREIKVLKNAQIISRNDPEEVGDVKFVGRYGTWNRRWKTELVIEEAMK